MSRTQGGLGAMNIPIVSDVTKRIASDFGALLEPEGVALRASFIVDTKGIVRHSSFNDLPIGRSVDEALRLIKAIQFYDEHGEVCPANWQPGGKTIDPRPAHSKAYFETLKGKDE